MKRWIETDLILLTIYTTFKILHFIHRIVCYLAVMLHLNRINFPVNFSLNFRRFGQFIKAKWHGRWRCFKTCRKENETLRGHFIQRQVLFIFVILFNLCIPFIVIFCNSSRVSKLNKQLKEIFSNNFMPFSIFQILFHNRCHKIVHTFVDGSNVQPTHQIRAEKSECWTDAIWNGHFENRLPIFTKFGFTIHNAIYINAECNRSDHICWVYFCNESPQLTSVENIAFNLPVVNAGDSFVRRFFHFSPFKTSRLPVRGSIFSFEYNPRW